MILLDTPEGEFIYIHEMYLRVSCSSLVSTAWRRNTAKSKRKSLKGKGKGEHVVLHRTHRTHRSVYVKERPAQEKILKNKWKKGGS